MLTVHTKLRFKDGADLLNQMGLNPGGGAQQLLDKLVVDRCQPYVPFDTGTLARSPYAVTNFGSGRVIYPGPYAHYQYYGEIYGPNIPIKDSTTGLIHFVSPRGQKKTPTGRALQYNTEKNPLAGSHWFDRMKADHAKDIIEEVRRYVSSKS